VGDVAHIVEDVGHIVEDHVPLVDHGHGLVLHYVQARDHDYDKAAAELILQLKAADVQQGQLVGIDVHSNGLNDPAVFVAFFCPSLPRHGAPGGNGLKLAFESQLHKQYDWKEFYSKSHDFLTKVAPHHKCDPGVRRGQIVALTGHVSQSFEHHLQNQAPAPGSPGEDEEDEEGEEETEESRMSSPESRMSSPEISSPSPGIDRALKRGFDGATEGVKGGLDASVGGIQEGLDATVEGTKAAAAGVVVGFGTATQDLVAAAGAKATMAAAETSAMGAGATALLPELSENSLTAAVSPISKSRQINAARDWLANAEGVVTANSPLVKAAPAAADLSIPPIEVEFIDATVEGTKAAAVEGTKAAVKVTELGESSAGLMKSSANLLKGVGGSLLSMGGSFFGAAKSTPSPEELRQEHADERLAAAREKQKLAKAARDAAKAPSPEEGENI